jgi:aminoglycoside 6'-N-acetyltransferase I
VTVTIRLLQDGDQALLASPEVGVFDRGVDPALADAVLRDPRHHIVAAIEEGRIVGFVSAVDYVHPDKPLELWINEVGVTSRMQRQGVGTQLMRATLDHARALGCVEAWVLADRRNAAALALYSKLSGMQEGTNQVMFTFTLGNRLR